MMKSSFLVIVFLVFIATARSENEILDLLKKWIGGPPTETCMWGKGDDYPSFSRGDSIEMLDGCYTCIFDDNCKIKCDPGPKKCNPIKGGICEWKDTGLPKMLPRMDVYKDDTHVCEFSVKGCEYMCWNFASESARRKRILTLLEELRSD